MARWTWRLLQVLLALAVAFGVGVLLGAPVAWPFDVVVNAAPALERRDLAAPADGRRRLVVLQHGLFRTSASVGRLERTLRAHGYAVLNPGYPSTRGTIESHAERLAAAVEAELRVSAADEVHFVGHSMGGLVIEEYLRRDGAPTPASCVYLGTPHRGAVLAGLRRHWFLFQWAMGDEAAMQLSPGDSLHTRPIPHVAVAGAVVGDLGEGNPSIPGHDDGTVAVGEAVLLGAAHVVLPLGHTRLTFADAAIEQVLHFLRRRAFLPAGR
jgi:triacylglycerol lipase